jgi:RNA polymerase-binding transcription factor DksA
MNAPFTLVDLQQSETDMTAVEQAVAAMDAGTFATCVVCGGDLTEVVKASPLQRTCADHLPLV